VRRAARASPALLALLAALAGCGGLSDDSSCGEWLKASQGDRDDYVADREKRLTPPQRAAARDLVTATCNVSVRSGANRVTVGPALDNAVQALPSFQ
jgi:hypothetical protein